MRQTSTPAPEPMPEAPASPLAELLDSLNAQQHEAVTHPAGPILVVAGPGTGKTQVLAARVAWVLAQPDAPKPSEILCLTYTDMAAHNMRHRLRQLLGPIAHEVEVHTFHSFGRLIIQDNEELLGRHDLALASETETRQFYTDLIDELPPGHPLRRETGDIYYEAQRLELTFSIMKKEGWTGTQWVEALEAYRQQLPALADYQYQGANKTRNIKKGDPHPENIKKETKRIELSQAAAALFEPFQERWQQAKRYDYYDMLGWAIGLLRAHPTLCERYQEQFQHVMVDEYQDTNGAQNQLLWLVAGPEPDANILVVGDDDQSIFRFQGACLANLEAFTDRYPAAAVVVLTNNYRSSARVLETASRLIIRNQERLCHKLPNVSKQLVACHPQFKASAVAPAVRRYQSAWHEATHIADELATLYTDAGLGCRCAVLAHDRNQLDVLARLLAARGIPFFRKRQVNVLKEEALATSLHRVLTYLAEALRPVPALAEPSLFAVLHLECFGVPHADLVRLAASYQQRFPRGSVAWPWREWLASAAEDPETADDLRISAVGRPLLASALAQLDHWIRAAASLPVAEVVELVVRNTLLPWQVTHYPHPAHQHAVVRTLRSFLQAEETRQSRLTYEGLLIAWDITAATTSGLPLERTTGSEAAHLHLLTAHTAKGLEFERVWLLGCQQNVWHRKSSPRHYVLPPALAARSTGSSEEESRRVFFVALTRSQEHLTISYASQDFLAAETAECRFITELAQDGLVADETSIPDESVVLAQTQLHTPAVAAAPLPDSAALDERLDNFTLSITILNTYLRCPIGCYYEQLLEVPYAENESQAFGKAIHQALERYFRAARDDERQEFGPAEELVEAFEKAFWHYRATLPPVAYQRRQAAGRRWLLDFHAHFQPTWLPHALTEHPVAALLPNGIELTGVLDRLDPHPQGGHQVVDYKTGKPDNAGAALKPAAPNTSLAEWVQDPKVRGGDYWRQAVFYHLLLKYDITQAFQPLGIHFQYLPPREDKVRGQRYEPYEVNVQPEDEAAVLAQITAVDAAIRARDFSHGCGTCYWCLLRGKNATHT